MNLSERLYEAGYNGNELAHEAVDEIHRMRKALSGLISGSLPALLAAKTGMVLGDEYSGPLEQSIADAKRARDGLE